MAVFDLEAVIKLTDQGFKQGLSKAGKAISTFAKVSGVAIAAGSVAVAGLVKQSVDAYADYEQLAGGVEKLFGTSGRSLATYAKDAGKAVQDVIPEWERLFDAQETVLQNANEAYKTSGMSANEYLESVTGISAALISSYKGDTLKAAEQADKAMRAISDNFNTFGGDITAVQSAYQGFAKQNYTMLDNLKLGYGGTKTEMERLIKDANAYAKSIGLAGNLSIKNYGDIVEAIDLIQQKQGIAGTTAKEAATTISGSLMMTKAAWKNLVRAFGEKGADLSQYFDALVTSAETAFDNILPVAQRALEGIGTVISDIVPKLGAKIPELITSTLPGMVKAGTSLVTSLISGFGAALPVLVAAIPDVIRGIRDGFVDAWPQLKEAGTQLMEMAGEGIKKAGPLLKDLSKKAADKILPVFSDMWDKIKKKAEQKLPGLTKMVTWAWEQIKSAAQGVSDFLSKIDFAAIFEGASDIIGKVDSAIGFLADHMDTVIPIVSGLATAAAGLFLIFKGGSIISTVTTAIGVAKTAFTGLFAVLAANPIGLVITAIAALGVGLVSAYKNNETFREKVDTTWAKLKEGASNTWGAIKTFVTDTWEDIKNGDWDSIKERVGSAWDSIKSGAGEKWDEIKQKVGEKWEEVKNAPVWASIGDKASEAWSAVKGTVGSAWTNIKTDVVLAWDKVKGGPAWTSISSKASEAWSAIQSGVSGGWAAIRGDVITAWSKVKQAPAWASISEKADSAWSAITGTISGAWSSIQSDVTTWWESVKSTPAWESISTNASSAWSSFKGTVSSGWTGIKTELVLAWNSAKNAPAWSLAAKAGEAWNSFIGAVGDWVDSVKQAIIDTWNKIVGGIKFNLPELPKLNITGVINWVTGKTSGIPSGHSGTPGKFAKANYQPYMFTNPSFFMAGEAGDEMLYGRTALMSDITDSVAVSNGALATQLSAILAELQEYLPSVKRPVVLDSGALVGGIGYDMDGFLGGYSEMGGRGLSLA